MGDFRIKVFCAAGLLMALPWITIQSQQINSLPRLPGMGGPLRVEFGTGYDFFSHSYTVLSVDTSSTMSEGNLHLNLHYTPLSTGNHTLEFGDRFFLGQQYTYNTLSAIWRKGTRQGLSTSAETRWETKRFTDEGFIYSNNYNAFLGTLRGAYRWSGQWSISGRVKAERFDYDHHNTFFYDTRTLSAALMLRGGDWTGPWFELEAGGRSQAAPDTTALDHGDSDLRLVLGMVFPTGGDLQATIYQDVRTYGNAGPRPDRTMLGARLDGRIAPLSRWGMWLEAGIERRTYGEQTLIYNDGTELRFAAGPSWHPGEAWEVRFGTGWQNHRTEGYTDSSYVDLFGVTQLTDSWSQPFLFTEANVFSSGGFWAFLTLETGWRSYESDTEWDSDFWYVDLSATLEVPVWKGLAIQALINLTPERHREPEDNSVTNYTSIDLIYRF
ncbi:hypothetical protein ACFL3H_06965 [Gemmatimonadota bacterium]